MAVSQGALAEANTAPMTRLRRGTGDGGERAERLAKGSFRKDGSRQNICG